MTDFDEYAMTKIELEETMNIKKMIGIILLICGIAMILFSVYINNQVSQGKATLSNAQSAVEHGSSLFSRTPVTKQIGNGLTRPMQRQIDEGQSQIAYYEGMAGWLLAGGIGFIVLSGFAILFYRKK